MKNCCELEQEWRDILDGKVASKQDDFDRISNELRNSIRSIEWDLEDLDETINILLISADILKNCGLVLRRLKQQT